MVNSSTMTLIVIVMAIYFIGMIAISWMGRKYGKNFDDFISAGRNCTTLMIIGFAVGSHIGNGYVVGGAASGAACGSASPRPSGSATANCSRAWIWAWKTA